MASAPSKLQIAIVSANAETIAELSAYLAGVGVDSRACSDPSDLATRARRAAAIVVFPDELSPAPLRAALLAARRRRPDLTLVFVTSRPREIELLAGRTSGAVVLPKPAFGWTIVDALRAAQPKRRRSGG